MNAKLLIVAIAMILCAIPSSLLAQNSMGVGTTTPNANAVLELVSPGNNQGFLVPRLSTAERTAMSLSATENGLLVFDTDDQLFYFWVNPTWTAVSNGANGDMLASVYDPDENGSVTVADSVSVNFFDGTSIQYDLLSGVVGVRGGGISTTKLANLAVTTPKIADGAITNAKIGAGVITGNQIGIPASGGDVLTYSGSQWEAGALTVGSAEIIDGSITNADLGAGSVGTNQLGAEVITGDKIGIPATSGDVLKYNGTTWAASTETNTVLVDGSTITGDGSATSLAVGSIDATQINAGLAATGDVLKYDGTSWSASVEDNTVLVDGATITGDGSATSLAVGSIDATQINAGLAATGDVLKYDGTSWSASVEDNTVLVDGATITGDGSATSLAVGSIDATQINPGLANTGDVLKYDGTSWSASVEDNTVLVDGATITGDGSATSLAVGSIDATQINAGLASTGDVLKYDGTSWAASGETNTVLVDGATITGDGSSTQLAVGTLATSNLSDGSVTSAKIADATIVTADLGNAAVTATKLGTAAVQTAKIEDGAVTSSKLGFSAVSGDVLTYDGTNWTPTSNTSSQWVTTGSDIYYNSGNVSIGYGASTSSPLYVRPSATTASAIMIEQVSTGDAGLAFSETVGSAIYSMGIDQSDGGKFKISESSSPGGSALLTLDGANNRFGLGIQTPLDIAHAHATLSSISGLRLSHSTSGISASDGLSVQLNGTNAYFRNYETGSTFIGTAAAYTSISSSGDMNVSGSVTATAFSGDGTGLTFNNQLSVSDGLTGNINPLFFISRSDGNSAVAINFDNTVGQFNLGMTANEGFALSAPGANVGLAGDYIRVANNGDMGIGVANPSAKLDVAGSVEVNGDITTLGGVYRNVTQTTAATYTVLDSDYIIEISGGGTIVNLPDANVPIDGREIIFLVRGGGAHSLNLAAGDYFVIDSTIASTPLAVSSGNGNTMLKLVSVGNFWYPMN